MYPFFRMTKEFIKFRNASDLPLTGTHVSHHMCMPWDIDMFVELNNGRTLTLFDLGRMVLAKRVGLIRVLRKNKWRLTMAGAAVRYRRRIGMFESFEMRSRTLYWDDRFVYIEQCMWKANGECANQVIYRSAITDTSGIVAPDRVMQALGQNSKSPNAPDWVKAWLDAESLRPWPPTKD